MASPTSIELPLKIVTRAQPSAAGPQTIALVIAPGMGNYGRVWRIRSDATIAPPAPVVRDTSTSRVERLIASNRPLRRAGGGQ